METLNDTEIEAIISALQTDEDEYCEDHTELKAKMRRWLAFIQNEPIATDTGTGTPAPSGTPVPKS